ncbi:MAG: signal peptidase II [Alphaproteobacteria bacterium]|nr:signal peptidase II [Alphaproteobacteria bacterium]
MWFGLAIALLTFVLDQVSKLWLLGLMQRHQGFIEVTPFFNLVMVWNRGVSFGLFAANSSQQRWLLIGIAVFMVVVLLVWLVRSRDPWLAGGLGLVIGGAIGNVVDRLRFGAVADFFDFHAFGFHWPAFNIADSAIVVGVAILLLDGLFGERDRPRI